ncbi:hypothetical protein C8F04DRAFT_1190901 [Mycena alexandri]|uniref:Uncharacterized protein n=1 Tax=Mycena alexandri TaxID=1745969 RepID=A0AAD6SE51_9AGAR|nr:hypothetical protein C8F04DRAFT_1190901 [Mycena alexandri]
MVKTARVRKAVKKRSKDEAGNCNAGEVRKWHMYRGVGQKKAVKWAWEKKSPRRRRFHKPHTERPTVQHVEPSRLYPPLQSEAEFNSDSDEGRHTTRDLPPPGPQGEFYLELATSTRSPSNSLLTRPSGGEHPIDVEFTSVTKSFATVTGTVVGSSSDPSRTFQCHASTSNHHLDNPSPTATANSQPGDIYTHVKASTSGRGGTQVWIFTESSTWDDISDLWQECKLLIHPQYSDQVLSRKYDGTPNWIPRTLAVANAGGVNL